MGIRRYIINKLTRRNNVAGLEIIISPDGKPVFHLCVLTKSKSTIQRKETFTTDDYIVLKQHLPANTPVSLMISGRNIIHKKFRNEGNIDHKALLQKVLPNADINEFYLQQEIAGTDNIFVSVARRELIDKLFNELKNNKIDIVSSSFGPFCVNYVLPLLKEASNMPEIKISNYVLKIKDSLLESFHFNDGKGLESQFQLGDEQIEGVYILPYATGLTYFIPNADKEHSDIPMLKASAAEFNQKLLFQSLGWSLLVFFLALLLGNYAVFNHYYSKESELDGIVNIQKSAIDKYDTLTRLFAEKRQFLAKAGILTKPKTSFYADQIAQDIPSEVTLSEVNINPVAKSNNSDVKDLSFTTGLIDVYGICKNSLDLDTWLKIMQKKEWVKVINVLDYVHDKEANVGKFSLQIQVK